MIKILADSTCDLSKEVLELYDISLAPLTINIDGKL
ncbi:DegV family protein [Bacillus sp. ISL-55]|nr:DegV family protein [Bacillus sp. ISL-55]